MECFAAGLLTVTNSPSLYFFSQKNPASCYSHHQSGDVQSLKRSRLLKAKEDHPGSQDADQGGQLQANP